MPLSAECENVTDVRKQKRPGDYSPGLSSCWSFQNEAGKNARLDFRDYSKKPMILSITP
jgi:hypothetical protein